MNKSQEQLSESRHQRPSGVGGSIRWATRVLLFSVLAILEPLAQLSSFLAMLSVACAGLLAVSGLQDPPIREMLIGAVICAVIPVLYYSLMRFLRP